MALLNGTKSLQSDVRPQHWAVMGPPRALTLILLFRWDFGWKEWNQKPSSRISSTKKKKKQEGPTLCFQPASPNLMQCMSSELEGSPSDLLWQTSLTLEIPHLRLDVKNNFCSKRAVLQWHSCPGRWWGHCHWRCSRAVGTWHWGMWAVGMVGWAGVGLGVLKGLF